MAVSLHPAWTHKARLRALGRCGPIPGQPSFYKGTTWKTYQPLRVAKGMCAVVTGAGERFGASGTLLVILDYCKLGSGHSLFVEKEQVQEKPADQTPSSPASNHLDPNPPTPSRLPLAE